jgi:hypothetical protein
VHDEVQPIVNEWARASSGFAAIPPALARRLLQGALALERELEECWPP